MVASAESAAEAAVPAASTPQPGTGEAPGLGEMPDRGEKSEPRDLAPLLDPAVAALCTPLADDDPCGPDLDWEGDPDYLNFFAQVEGILPTSFFSMEDGKAFDPSSIDIGAQLEAVVPLMERTRDIRLLLIDARLRIMNRDLAGFAVDLAATAHWLEKFWDKVHPCPVEAAASDDIDPKAAALSVLELPTVVFALQYVPLFEVRRVGPISYRAWMLASGEAKPRLGDPAVPAAAISEAINDSDSESLANARRHIRLLKNAVDQIRNVCTLHNVYARMESFSALVDKMFAFIDPQAASAAESSQVEVAAGDEGPAALPQSSAPAGPAPTSISQAKQALAAIADYYGRLEPSSPTLPLVRQAHQLIGKSFIEVMTILVPSQVEKAAFQIGTDQGFELPLGKLSSLSAVPAAGPEEDGGNAGARYVVESRAQAVALLGLVQRYFRLAEPSSPVPMLCERARALAERDFMGVLKDVLPKSALKNIGSDK